MIDIETQKWKVFSNLEKKAAERYGTIHHKAERFANNAPFAFHFSGKRQAKS